MSIKVGFIGTGGIANAHMRCLSEIPEAEMVAFCDIVEEKAQDAAEKHNGKAFTDHKAISTPWRWTPCTSACRHMRTPTRS